MFKNYTAEETGRINCPTCGGNNCNSDGNNRNSSGYSSNNACNNTNSAKVFNYLNRAWDKFISFIIYTKIIKKLYSSKCKMYIILMKKESKNLPKDRISLNIKN